MFQYSSSLATEPVLSETNTTFSDKLTQKVGGV
jgi:hypothetical protein